MSTEQKNEIFGILSEMDGESVAQLFTDYHGMQLIDDGFAEFLQDEGISIPFLINDEEEGGEE